MKILLIGSGGREHALAHQFIEHGHEVYCTPGNAGIDRCTAKLPPKWQDVATTDIETLGHMAKALEVDLTVVGPEQALDLGIVNHFRRLQLPIFGPTAEATKMESSKAYSKTFMQKYGVPTARFEVCPTIESAYKAAEEFCRNSTGVVVKPSGLTAGKGVTLCSSLEEAKVTIDLMMTQAAYGSAGSEIVVEEYLSGQEVSILCLCDGKHMIPMPPAQDHKQLCDGDTGPNTGGMGAYAPAPFVNDQVLSEIQHHVIERTQAGLLLEGISYTGVLYFGIMLTAQGPRVLEYNCRFGDPETQALLPLMESDLAETMMACVNGDVQRALPRWASKHTVCVVICAKGYPGLYAKGAEITGQQFFEEHDDLFLYHAGTVREVDHKLRTSGGRVLGITATADSLEQAIDLAYKGVKNIHFEGAYCRSDIAAKAITVDNAILEDPGKISPT